MVFEFTDAQRALRETVAGFLDDHPGDDPATGRATWTRLAEELGVVGLLAPEDDGGAGAGPVEVAIVCEELGRRLHAAPYLSSAVLATALLRELGDRELLAEVASGRRVATVALAEPGTGWDPGRVTARSRDGVVTGTKAHVTDATAADLLLVVTRDGVVALDADAPGVRIVPGRALDPSRPLAAVECDGARGRPVGPAGPGSGPDPAIGAVHRALRIGEAALAAEQTGGARAVLEMSVAHARQRFQFGRAIGSFQAVKHLCADMLVEVESACSAAYRAAWELADGVADPDATVAVAQAFCSEAFVRAASDTVQIHGGIGFTWEHPAHRYLRRARSSARLLGGPDEHRERLVTALQRADDERSPA